MPEQRIIVVGASAGGVERLMCLVGALPPDLPAAALIVLHVPPYGASQLPQILSRAGPLPAVPATDGGQIQNGCIYVAPPNRHLTVEAGLLRLTSASEVNGHRPAIDMLFQTAAQAYGPGPIGVLLSGTLDDGTAPDEMSPVASGGGG